MASVIVAWTFIINIYFSFFYYTRNPFYAHSFQALSSSLWNLIKFAIKVAPPIYLVSDENLAYKLVFIIGISGGMMGYLVITKSFYPYYRYNK
jgi:hypothetical protein